MHLANRLQGRHVNPLRFSAEGTASPAKRVVDRCIFLAVFFLPYGVHLRIALSA
jgi:hypothetical protein